MNRQNFLLFMYGDASIQCIHKLSSSLYNLIQLNFLFLLKSFRVAF